MADTITDVLRALLRTEKGTMWLEPQHKYSFEVSLTATKQDIKRAVESAFKVNVLSVRTMRQHGKMRRLRRDIGQRPDWKRAIVTLAKGQKIEIT